MFAFNILMFISFILMLLSLLVVQVYGIVDSYREFKIWGQYSYIAVICGLLSTTVATITFMLAIIIYLFSEAL